MSSSDDSSESQYAYAMAEIEYPGVHDVLCGRGGHAISHSGNVNFRMIVEKFKTKYATASRYEKAKVIAEVVRIWRNQSPPGRFLTITDPSKGESSKWHDIGDNAASKKVAQCLRERNPRAEYTVGQAPATNAVAAAAAVDPVTSTATPLPTAATSSAAAAAFPAPDHSSVDWKRRKSSKTQKQRKQEVQPGIRQEPKSKSAVAHQQQHPKHQGQRQKQQQNAHNRHQNALNKKVQKQVHIAEQEVWQAQQQVNQQAHELQNAWMQRAQQEAAAAAATQVVLNQMALQQVEQEIWKEQNLVNQKMQPHQQQQQQQFPQDQQQQQFPQDQPQQQVQFQDQPQQQVQFQDQPQQQVHFQGEPMVNDEFQQKARQVQQVDNHSVERPGTQESVSDTMSSLDSPLMWDDCQGSTCNSNAPLSRRDSMAREMPSAARLTKNAFDDDTNNGSSDSSTATSGRMAKMIYNMLDTFSDTTSENSNENCANGDSNDGAISDGSNSIARPDAYLPD